MESKVSPSGLDELAAVEARVSHYGEPVSLEKIKQAHSSISESWLAQKVESHPVYKQGHDESCYFCALIFAVEAAEARVEVLTEALREIANHRQVTTRPGEGDCDWHCVAEMCATARAALAGAAEPAASEPPVEPWQTDWCGEDEPHEAHAFGSLGAEWCVGVRAGGAGSEEGT